MFTAGPRVIGVQGAVWSGVTVLVPVLVVCLVVPGAVVEVLVVVDDLDSVDPVDGYALVVAGVGGGRVVSGVNVFGAADGGELLGVLLDVGVAGGSAVLDEAVVVRDVVGLGIPLGGAVEQEAELIASGEAIGLEAPIGCDRGWSRLAVNPRDGDCVSLRGTVVGRYGHGEGVGPDV